MSFDAFWHCFLSALASSFCGVFVYFFIPTDRFTKSRSSLKAFIIRGGHPIFFSWFAVDGSITFSLLFDFDKSRILGI